MRQLAGTLAGLLLCAAMQGAAQLAPAAQRTIVIQQADGAESASAQSDELGRFRVTLEHAGTVRLLFGDGESDTAIETAWIPI